MFHIGSAGQRRTAIRPLLPGSNSARLTRRPLLIAAVAALSLGCLPRSVEVLSQSEPAESLLTTSRADRQERLEDKARAEGRLVWYTSLAGGSVQALASAVEARYPWLEVEVVRAGSGDLLTRVGNERQAGRISGDLISTNWGAMTSLRESGALTAYRSPAALALPLQARLGAEAELAYGAALYETYIGVGYNTRLISEADVPHSYPELLKPALKGKMAISGSDTGVRLLGNLLDHQGEDFVTRLAQQDVAVQMVSGQALLDLVVSGEVPLSPSIFRSHALTAAEKGAPVRWVPLEPVTVNTGAIGILTGAERPHAALLAAEVMLGPEGQRILAEFQYGSPIGPPGYPRWDPEQGRSSADFERAVERWEALLKERFLQR